MNGQRRMRAKTPLRPPSRTRTLRPPLKCTVHGWPRPTHVVVHRRPSHSPDCRWIRRVQTSTGTAGTRFKKGGQESRKALPLPHVWRRQTDMRELPARPTRALPPKLVPGAPAEQGQTPYRAGCFMGVRSQHASETKPSAHRKRGPWGYVLRDPPLSPSRLRRERQPCRGSASKSAENSHCGGHLPSEPTPLQAAQVTSVGPALGEDALSPRKSQ